MRIDSRISRLDATFIRARDLPTGSEAQADYSKYLCILVSGFLEKAVETLVAEYVGRRAHPSVHRYVSRTFKAGNLNTQRLLDVVGHFDPELHDRFALYLGDERRDAINSVFGNRNNIAHGDDVGISYHRVKDYYASIKQVVRFLGEEWVPSAQ